MKETSTFIENKNMFWFSFRASPLAITPYSLDSLTYRPITFHSPSLQTIIKSCNQEHLFVLITRVCLLTFCWNFRLSLEQFRLVQQVIQSVKSITEYLECSEVMQITSFEAYTDHAHFSIVCLNLDCSFWIFPRLWNYWCITIVFLKPLLTVCMCTIIGNGKL